MEREEGCLPRRSVDLTVNVDVLLNAMVSPENVTGLKLPRRPLLQTFRRPRLALFLFLSVWTIHPRVAVCQIPLLEGRKVS
jgi:hypothetical protein